MDEEIIRDAADRIRLAGGVPTLEGVEAYLRGKAAAVRNRHPEAARAYLAVVERIVARQITKLPERRTLAQIVEEKRRAFLGLDPKGTRTVSP